jgi:hypothetical protein
MGRASRGVITEGPKAAIGFLVVAWKRAWAAMAATAALFGALWSLGLLSAHSSWRPAAVLVLIAAAVIVEGGLYRTALGRGRPGPAGFQWGGVEWRLSAVWGLTMSFLGVLALLGFVVILAFAFAVASAGHGFVVALPATWSRAVDGRARAVVAVVGALVLAGMIWALARVSLAPAATVAKNRIQVLASWPTTRGLVWSLIAGRLILGAAPIGCAVAILYLAMRPISTSPMIVWVASLAAGIVLAGIWLPLNVGFMAYLYKQIPPLRPEDDFS